MKSFRKFFMIGMTVFTMASGCAFAQDTVDDVATSTDVLESLFPPEATETTHTDILPGEISEPAETPAIDPIIDPGVRDATPTPVVYVTPIPEPIIDNAETTGVETNTADSSDGFTFNGLWGLLGLIGLAGLFGKKKKDDVPMHTLDKPAKAPSHTLDKTIGTPGKATPLVMHQPIKHTIDKPIETPAPDKMDPSHTIDNLNNDINAGIDTQRIKPKAISKPRPRPKKKP